MVLNYIPKVIQVITASLDVGVSASCISMTTEHYLLTITLLEVTHCMYTQEVWHAPV